MLTYITITGTFYYRTTPTKTPAAGVVIEFVPRTAARPDGTEVLLPKTLSVTLDNAGKIPVGFSVPTLPDGVYYTVREMFDGGRGKYTILVKPGDPATDLSSVAPVVPPPLLVSTRGPRGLPGPQPPLSGMVPYALGTASSGSGTKASREDHVHPMPSAVQIGAVDTSDPRLSDSREWTAATVTQFDAEAGTDTARKAWSVLRVWQAIAAWWATSSAKSKLDGIAAGATVGADWDTNVSNRPTLGTAATKNAPASGDAAAGEVVLGNDSRLVGGGGGSGDVVGPASSTDGHVALFDGATGKLLKDGGALGTAASSDVGDFATAGQGALADSALQPNAPITGATKTKITYDADGLITAGADATTADIADSTNKRYVTDAQLVVIGNTSGTNTGDQTSVTGNAGTATALQTARTIGGVSFDGTANINLPGVNTTGNQNTSGSAATLTTSRNIGGIAFNGSANIEPSVSEVSRTTSWTLGLSDRNTLQVQTHASPQTCTIPPQSSVTWVGPTTILILAHGSGALTLDADTGVTLNGVSGGSVALDKYQNAVLRWISSDVWVVSGTSADVA